MGGRTTLAVTGALALVVGVVVWLLPATPGMDATTSDAPPIVLTGDVPTSFGAPAWTRDIGSAGGADVVVSDGYVVLREPAGVRVLDLPTGVERWHHLDAPVQRVAAADGSLAVVSADRVRMFDLASGMLLTTVQLSGGERRVLPYRDSFLVLPDRRADEPYRMYATDGAVLWTRAQHGCRGTPHAYAAGDVLVLATSCPRTTNLVGVDPAGGRVRWRADVRDAAPLSLPSPPAATRLVAGAPVVLRTRTELLPLDAATGRRLPAAPWPQGAADLASVPGGWCYVVTEPAPQVRCRDVGAAAEHAPIALAQVNDHDPRVRILPRDDGVTVASTTNVSLTVATSTTGRAVEVMPGADDPEVVHHGPGALVVRTDDELTVYS